jgi:hypothetical protein
MTLRPVLLLAVFSGLAGCTSATPVTEDAGFGDSASSEMDARATYDSGAASQCPGSVRPSLSECVAGSTYAECEGSGEPRFACSAHRCLWFSNGCIAEGFVPSECPPSDPCCVAAPGGHWISQAWPFSTDQSSGAIESVVALGRRIYGAEAPGVVLQVDPEHAPAEPGITCDDGVTLEVCRGLTQAPVMSAGAHVLGMRLFAGSEHFEALQIELVPQDEGTLLGRAFVVFVPDLPPSSVTCEAAYGRPIDVDLIEGVVSRSDLPVGAVMHGTLTLAAPGGQVEIRF